MISIVKNMWMAGVCLWALSPLYAGTRLYRYRVSLTDKQKTEYSLSDPLKFLSQKSLDRRTRQGLPVDSTDLPVCSAYLSALKEKGVKVVGTGKWTNTVLVETDDTLRIPQLEELPFVKSTVKVWTMPDSIPARDRDRKDRVQDVVQPRTKDYYGNGQCQVEMLHADQLHQAGFRGKGMTIAVIDGGFLNADVIPLLKKVKVLGTRNFVHPGWDVYAESDHGTSVLSCMAANTPHQLVGTAPEAQYWLFCSEDMDTECLAEEDYWVQAVEYADSLGVDLINTSLGYNEFDDQSKDYRYRDLDGRTSLMSRQASMAAAKGMVVVCSAGNSGNKTWKKMTPPADADHILAVGAVDKAGLNTVFSSVGYSADGRVKPDVMARGGAAAVIRSTGKIGTANGTSFASPVMCGAVACLWQACPQLTAEEVMELVRRAGDRYDFPDNIFGYGIPDVWKAYLSSKP